MGSSTFAAVSPTCAAMCPPATNMRPSASCAVAEQNVLTGASVFTKAPVFGS